MPPQLFTPPKTPRMIDMLRATTDSYAPASDAVALPLPYPEASGASAGTLPVAAPAPMPAPVPTAPIAPAAPPESAGLSAQLAKLNAPPSTKQSLLDAVLAFAPTAIAGLAGGLPAAAGAAGGVNTALAGQAAAKAGQQKSLIEQIEAAKGREQQSGEFAATMGMNRQRLAQDASQFAAREGREGSQAEASLAEQVAQHAAERNKPIAVGGDLVKPTGEVLYNSPDKATQPLRPIKITSYDPISGKTYDEYLTPEEAQGRKFEQTPRATSGNPTNTRNTRIDAKVREFLGLPTVKKFAEVSEISKYANDFPVKTASAGDDYTLLVTLAKAVDPGSVAREGEVQAAASAAQSILENYGINAMSVLSKQRSLTDAARQTIIDTIKRKVEPNTVQYRDLRTSYKDILTSLGATKEEAERFLPDVSGDRKIQPNSPYGPEEQRTLATGEKVRVHMNFATKKWEEF